MMDGLTCDGCDAGLLLDSDVRYVVRIEGYAAYDPLELTREDLERDLAGEMRQLLQDLEKQSAEKAQDEVHRAMSFDLCPECWRRFLRDPLAAARKRPGPSDDPAVG